MKNTILTKSDFVSGQEVRWCPGCGDYAILASVQKIMPELNIPRENIVFISGIGCAGRFPYYMNTYGFHTIHGRAPAVATGLKMTRPELSVWLVTGDGDALSIGGNHLIHTLRRNLDINILLFNNRIYGLTKGQYSPTSEQGKVTGTSPAGSLDQPLDPIAIALAAGATFVARVLDIDAKNLQSVLKSAAAHKGTAFIEIYQNCHIYNDGAFASISNRDVRDEKTIWIEPGQPLRYGKNKDRKVMVNNLETDIYDHTLAHSILQLTDPVPFGIFRNILKPTYEGELQAQQQKAISKKGIGNLEELLNSGQVWDV
ncbi:MAG: 2-oxoacid:ferredoxin oxidoreductase subunit beta [Gammaproteobacteria bacterium]